MLNINFKMKKKLFCDLSVYRRSLNFRLYGSSKFGKSAELRVAEINTWNDLGNSCTMSEEVFFASLLSENHLAANVNISFGEENLPIAVSPGIRELVVGSDTGEDHIYF